MGTARPVRSRTAGAMRLDPRAPSARSIQPTRRSRTEGLLHKDCRLGQRLQARILRNSVVYIRLTVSLCRLARFGLSQAVLPQQTVHVHAVHARGVCSRADVLTVLLQQRLQVAQLERAVPFLARELQRLVERQWERFLRSRCHTVPLLRREVNPSRLARPCIPACTAC
jgi:hypothetical protein